MRHLPEHTRLPTTDILRDVRDVLPWLEAAVKSPLLDGISIKPNSRYARHLSRLQTELAQAGLDTTVIWPFVRLRRLQQAMVEVLQLKSICDNGSFTSRWREPLQRSLSGSDVPWTDVNDHPRNTAFELHVAQILEAAGFRCHPREPDIIAERPDGWRVSLAVKRLKSRKKVLDRIRDGLEQISRSQIPGFVLVDASVLFMDRDKFAKTNSPDYLNDLVTAKLDDIYEEIKHSIRSRYTDPLWHLGIGWFTFIPAHLRPHPNNDDLPSTFCVVCQRRWTLWKRWNLDPRMKDVANFIDSVAGVPAL